MSTQTTWQDKLVKEAGKLDLKPPTTVVAEGTPKVAEPPAADTIPGATAEQQTAPVASSEAAPTPVPNSTPETTTDLAAQRGAKKPEEELPDLSVIVVPDINDEAHEQEAAQKRQWAQGAASKLIEIRDKIKHAEGKLAAARADENHPLAEMYQKDLDILRGEEEILLNAGSEGVRKSRGFSELIEEIRRTDARNFNAIQAMIVKILTTERYRLATTEEFKSFVAAKKCPWGTIFYAGKTYIPNIPAEQAANWKTTAATRTLESVFRGKIEEAKKHFRSEAEAKVVSMKERGTGRAADILNGVVETYYLHSPARRENGVDRKEGHVLISLRDANKDPQREPFLVVDVVEAIGGLSWFEGIGRRSFPLFWLQRGRVITKPNQRLDDMDFKRAVGMIVTVRALIQVNTPTTTIETTAAATPAPTEPTQTQPAPEATTATENSTTPETASNEQQELAPKPGRKTRRKK